MVNQTPIMERAEEPNTVDFQSILRGLPDSLNMPGPSLLYRLGLLLVAIFMVLLPLLYLGLIGLLIYGVYYHAVNHAGILSSDHGGLISRLLVYLTPIVAGGIAAFFMFKPLFARPAQATESYGVTPEQEPLLFEYIGRLCALLGAPVPVRVELDCAVNASASFAPGHSSLLTRKLVLTIGLPLAAGLDLRQLTGVLAHEFGHFSQAAGMRLTFVIRTINAWFYRVVYARDEWDEWLATTARESDWRIAAVLQAAKATVWLSRRVLWCLATIGNFVSCFMLRQMEFNADGYEIRLGGSRNFEATCLKMAELNLGWEHISENYSRLWRAGHPADDIPRLVAAGTFFVSPDARNEMAEKLLSRKSAFFDTHPSNAARIAAARRAASPGAFGTESPSSALFADFAEICRAVTRFQHEQVLGRPVPPECLVKTDALLNGIKQDRAASLAIESYLGQAWTSLRALPLGESDGVEIPALNDCQAGMLRAKAEMERLRPAAEQATQRFLGTEERIIETRNAARRGDGVLWFDDHISHHLASSVSPPRAPLGLPRPSRALMRAG